MRSLRRRFGRASVSSAMTTVGDGAKDVYRAVLSSPIATSAVLGAGAGLAIAEVGALPAMALGAAAGVVIEKVVGK